MSERILKNATTRTETRLKTPKEENSITNPTAQKRQLQRLTQIRYEQIMTQIYQLQTQVDLLKRQMELLKKAIR